MKRLADVHAEAARLKAAGAPWQEFRVPAGALIHIDGVPFFTGAETVVLACPGNGYVFHTNALIGGEDA